MTHDRPVLGILLMLSFCVLAPISDGLSKLIAGSVPVLQIVFVRFLAQTALWPLALRKGRPVLNRRVLWAIAQRTILHIVGIFLMITALRVMPLADAIAIAFVMPFIVLLLGHFFVGEEVGPRRLFACAIGFVGTLMVVQPSFAVFGLPALLPLGVAVVFALFMMVTRKIAKEVEPIALQAVSGTMAILLLAPLMMLADGGGHPLLDPIWPDQRMALLLVVVGIVGTLAHLMMTWSLRFAPSSTLAPMQYLEIPFAALVGWMLFRDFPNGLALAGITVTIAAGLFILWVERAKSRAVA